MRDWKKRFIVAGILLFGVICILVYRYTQIVQEAKIMESASVVTTKEGLDKALKREGVIYIKGVIEGGIDMKDVSLVDNVLSKDPADIPKGYERVFFGKYMQLEVKRGRYEYDKDAWEKNRHYEYHFFSRETLTLKADVIHILGYEFDVTRADKLLDRCGALKHNAGEGAMHYVGKKLLPTFDVPYQERYYEGFEAFAYPSDIEGALKIELKNGELLEGEMMILPADELAMVEEMAETGEFDFTTEIGAYLIVWVFLVLLAWLFMKFFGM